MIDRRMCTFPTDIRFLLTIIVAACLVGSPRTWAHARTPVKRVTIANGVRLVLVPESEGDTFALTMFIRERFSTTPAEEAARQIVNTSLFYGSVHLSYEAAGDLARKIGSVTTRQTPEYLAVTCLTSPDHYRDAIYFLTEGIKNAEFEPAALDKARESVLRMREEREGDPFLAAYDRVCRALYPAYIPDAVQLRHVTQEAAAAYFRTHFVPAATVFSAAGNLDLSAVQRSLDNNLFDYDRAGTQPDPSKSRAKPQAVVQAPAGGSLSYAMVAVDRPDVADPDYPAYCVLTTVLGGGHASRMFRDIRDAAGIGYSVGAVLRPEDGDPMAAYVQWEAHTGSSAPTARRVLGMIEAQLDALTSPQAAITDAELSRARNFAIGQYALRHERIQERCFLPGWYEAIGAGYTMDAELPARLAAVTKDDLLRVARKYLVTLASVISGG